MQELDKLVTVSIQLNTEQNSTARKMHFSYAEKIYVPAFMHH